MKSSRCQGARLPHAENYPVTRCLINNPPLFFSQNNVRSCPQWPWPPQNEANVLRRSFTLRFLCYQVFIWARVSRCCNFYYLKPKSALESRTYHADLKAVDSRLSLSMAFSRACLLSKIVLPFGSLDEYPKAICYYRYYVLYTYFIPANRLS
jgi:hypothetical protein